MIPLSRRVLTPRTPGGWALFIGRIAAAVLLVLVTLGACVLSSGRTPSWRTWQERFLL